jgi:predicted acylesterase/phospholipase RssA
MKSVFMMLVALTLAACASSATVSELRTPVPETLVKIAAVPGYGKIRYWGDDGSSISAEVIARRREQLLKAAELDPTLLSQPTTMLTVSGGGSNGAFGAGLLVGWTATGKRPNFDLVTGISTGSLTAPFAFLGTPYDQKLRDAFTTISGDDVMKRRGALAILGGQSIASNDPLRKMVSGYVTDQMVDDIAREHAKGRRLLIGTTNIDADRPVIWDIGEIASSGVADRKMLIANILVASAAIPGVFPPVRITVTADGKTYDELHVDGGTSNQVFLLPANMTVKQLDPRFKNKRTRQLYIIRNAKTTPEYSQVKPVLASVAGKALSSLTKTQGIGDLYRMYTQAQRDHMDFNLISIPESFTKTEPKPFDTAYMVALYGTGYDLGRTNIPWQKVPPGLN